MSNITLYSAKVCPFAQRTRMVLLEKGVDFELIEIDLQNKPDGFSQISPYGKVPVMKHGENTIWESWIINEYLEEVFPDPALIPKDPGLRAIARIWIDFGNTKLIPAFYKLLLNQDLEQQQEWAAELRKHLLFMEHEGLRKLSQSGPYWLGEVLSLVDLSFYPWFERWSAIEHYRKITVPSECSRLNQWWKTMENCTVVQQTAHPASFHIEQYAKYANNTASGVTAQEMRRY